MPPLIGFGRASPAVSVMDRRQASTLFISIAVVVVVGGFAPTKLIALLGWTSVAVLMLVSTFRAWAVLKAFGGRTDRAGEPALLATDELPRYTLLVPLYGEANVVAELATHLRSLDFPRDRLEILLLCEADDVATIDVVRELGLEHPFRLIACPDGTPRTKPRACNIGLAQATGDLCVVYDAEDRPEPDQLLRAAAVFAEMPADVVCLQARLDYYDAERNWLARCFSLEYAILFRLLLPGLIAADLPVPLGGTSNHFRTDRLRDLGGWDPYNVTEDADLGMRIFDCGLRTAMLDSTTFEEPCARLLPWTRQRTRWMKGYLQTWLVHSRTRGRGLGGRSRFLLHLVIGGGPIAAVASPLAAAVLLTSAALPAAAPAHRSMSAAIAVSIGAYTVILHGLNIALVRVLIPRWSLWRGIVSMAVYSLMISFATYRAVWHLARRPHHWEKTPHGLFVAALGDESVR